MPKFVKSSLVDQIFDYLQSEILKGTWAPGEKLPSETELAASLDVSRMSLRSASGFVVSYPDLPGCITCGETVEQAVANAQDAKKAWLEAALEDGAEIHEPDSLEGYSGQFKLRIPRSLHRSLAEHSQREGISMNQYCVYLLSKNDAVFSK